MVQTPARPADTSKNPVPEAGSVSGAETGKIDLETFLQLPETEPASEYIDGKIVRKPMPKGKHSRLQKRLTAKVESVLLEAAIAEAFPELRCTFGDRAIVPDIAVFQCKNIPRDADGEIANIFEIPPDWVIEIFSPDQDAKKVINKILHCLDHGCEMGWLIDPEEHEVMTYPSSERSRSFTQPEAILPVPAWATALQLSAGELFRWLTA